MRSRLEAGRVLAYGYEFPDATRLAILADHLEVITRMLGPGRATYEGRHAHVRDAIHEPKGLQPRIPVVVGGNGPKVTWRPAARYADELCLDALMPDDVAKALPVIRDRCEKVGRDPVGLRVAVHVWGESAAVAPGPARQDQLAEYADLGVDLGRPGPSRPSAVPGTWARWGGLRGGGLLDEPASGVGDG
jgi:alkanesulfonate monooxygenase SsuD/methylene tetrahydromethanopterin reductase-like flavin-dependent oxidoreductase (luciferase family)